jgi:ribosome-associated protein
MTPSTPQQPRISKQTRILVQAAAAACEEKKGQDTRILELDPIDSGLSDFFLITSASNNRQTVAIADEIEMSLKRQFGTYPRSVEGRRLGEWILMDYVDFVVHVFLAERRAYYDIERLRKSARPLTPAEFDAELTAALTKKTVASRKRTAAKPIALTSVPAAKAGKKAAAKRAVKKPTIEKPASRKPGKKAAAKKAVAIKLGKKPAIKSAKNAAVKKKSGKKR